MVCHFPAEPVRRRRHDRARAPDGTGDVRLRPGVRLAEQTPARQRSGGAGWPGRHRHGRKRNRDVHSRRRIAPRAIERRQRSQARAAAGFFPDRRIFRRQDQRLRSIRSRARLARRPGLSGQHRHPDASGQLLAGAKIGVRRGRRKAPCRPRPMDHADQTSESPAAQSVPASSAVAARGCGFSRRRIVSAAECRGRARAYSAQLEDAAGRDFANARNPSAGLCFIHQARPAGAFHRFCRQSDGPGSHPGAGRDAAAAQRSRAGRRLRRRRIAPSHRGLRRTFSRTVRPAPDISRSRARPQ